MAGMVLRGASGESGERLAHGLAQTIAVSEGAQVGLI
jgi:hypothetical protein